MAVTAQVNMTNTVASAVYKHSTKVSLLSQQWQPRRTKSSALSPISPVSRVVKKAHNNPTKITKGGITAWPPTSVDIIQWAGPWKHRGQKPAEEQRVRMAIIVNWRTQFPHLQTVSHLAWHTEIERFVICAPLFFHIFSNHNKNCGVISSRAINYRRFTIHLQDEAMRPATQFHRTRINVLASGIETFLRQKSPKIQSDGVEV